MFPDALKADSLICMPLRERPSAAMERIASVFVIEPAHRERFPGCWMPACMHTALASTPGVQAGAALAGDHVEDGDHAARESRQGLEEGPWDSATSCHVAETAICSGSTPLGALLLGFCCEGLLPKR